MFTWLENGVWYLLMFIPGLTQQSSLGKALHFFVYDVVKIIILLSVMIFIISYIRSYFQNEKIKELLNRKQSWLGYPIAAFLGIISPFCSCSTIPLFIGFVEAGIPLGITFTFLITSPLINEAAIAILFATFGWKLTSIYVLAGVTVGISGGAVIRFFNPRNYIEEYIFKIKSKKIQGLEMKQKERFLFAKDQVLSIVQKVGLFILLGVGVGAAIHGWLPEGFMNKLAGRDNPFAVFAAVIMGIPLYSGAVATIPVVEALMQRGAAPGTALAFMMAVTALSVPEFIILRKVMKPKLIAIFAVIVGTAIIGVGLLFNVLELFIM